MTRIVLVRHGQTAWNKEIRFRGQVDVPLNKFGLEQAEATGRYVAVRWPVAAVYASRMSRAMQTAEPIARAHGLTVQPLAGLLDVNCGEWGGLSPDEAAERDPDLLRAWYDAPHTVQFPGGENLIIVRERVLTGLEEVVVHHPGQTVALVSHSVVNRVLLCAVLGLGNDHFWRLQQDTCAVNVFDVKDGISYDDWRAFTLVLMNDTCHLHRDL
ncbi:MAG: histidine phosphatase family protein [Chloroflexi bacterium]|nr:MAG: histidine phosphatase family protein [Chloroflexota bacterium]